MQDILTIREAVRRAKAEGLPVSEYTLRRWVKTGEVPTRSSGNRILIYFPNLVRFLQGDDYVPITDGSRPCIRRIDAR